MTMNETTTAKPPRQRKNPERFVNLCPVGDIAVLVLRESHPKGDQIDTYTLEFFPSEIGGRGFELTKPDGTRYHVNLIGKASTCTCPGFEHHGWHIDRATGELVACKHIMSLLGLEQAGRL
jgi:SWIM zinc finger